MSGIVWIRRWKSPVGNLVIGAFDGRLCLCDWCTDRRRAAVDPQICRHLDAAIREIPYCHGIYGDRNDNCPNGSHGGHQGERHGDCVNSRHDPALPIEQSDESSCRIIDRTVHQLDEYFAGCRKSFDLPLFFAGTDFRRTVWRALLDIPYATTISYGDLARRLGRPDATRAVANAVGANPISIIVPCHRVVGSDGSLTGYAGGLTAKRHLLDLEARKGDASSHR